MHVVCVSCFRYNCNRYNEDDAKAARDAQEVRNNNSVDLFVLCLLRLHAQRLESYFQVVCPCFHNFLIAISQEHLQEIIHLQHLT